MAASRVATTRPAPSGPTLLGLQATAGNRAVTSVIQRLADEAALTVPLLNEEPRVVAAANNDPPLRQGEHSDGVSRLQQGLVAAGYDMPISTKEAGAEDGKYGPETFKIVRKFQSENGVQPVGGAEAGRKTLHALDAVLASLSPDAVEGAPGTSGQLNPVRPTGPTRIPGPVVKLPPATKTRSAPSAAAFTNGVFTEPAYRPEDGSGSLFFASYSTQAARLSIGVKATGDFRDSAALASSGGPVPKAEALPGVGGFDRILIDDINTQQSTQAGRQQAVEQWRWQPGQAQNFANQVTSVAAAAWSTRKTGLSFVLDQTGFPQAKASVDVAIEVADSRRGVQAGGPVPLPSPSMEMVVWARRPGLTGGDAGAGSTRDNQRSAMTLDSNEATGRTDNPLVMEWDPNGKFGDPSNVEAFGHRHRAASLTNPDAAGKVPVFGGEPIKVLVKGPDAATQRQDQKTAVDALVRGCGDAKRLQVTTAPAGGRRGATITVGDAQPQVVAVHEFGHTFGLGDEYDPDSPNNIRKAGDAASHDPQARAMGQNGPKGALVESNDNIMSEGNDVRPQHYATFLDCLKRITGLTGWHLA